MSIIRTKDIEALKIFIESHDFFFIIGHKEPDGDCIASCLGMASLVNKFGKEYQLLSAGPFKRNEIQRFEKDFSNTMIFLDEAQRKQTGLIITDCSEYSRLGEIDGDFKGLDTFIIDHHKTSQFPEGAQGYVNSNAAACAYLVQLFYEEISGPIPEETAKILMFGICTDTGFFRFLTTNDESADLLSATSRLVSYGANPRQIYNDINNGKAYSTRKLLGLLLNKAERYLNDRLVITYETLEDTQKYGKNGRDSDALYQLLLSSEKVEAVVFLRQDTPNTCTGGFRSQDKIDVSAVAAKFGGGGHKNAAGMSTDGKLENLIPKIISEFSKIM
ncbi:MAG: bifunctional oligoribonuclease/PAP phosphatase NrnA [Treponema sp.]|nr:bifunctional oligoribonuclease/PAP phosphatase NrnA [Treponema sp.]